MTIKELRKVSGLGQTAFAERYEIPIRTLRSWEYGERETMRYTINMLINILTLEGKMMLYTANKETGDFIEKVGSIEEGKKLIAKYEKSDKTEGIYEEDFYDIVDQNHCSVL